MKRNRLQKATGVLLALIMLLSLCVTAQAAEIRVIWNYRYEILKDGSAKILEFRGKDTDVVVPAELEGYPVTEIGDKAFYQKRSLNSINLPDGVKKIGNRAFNGCDSLTSVALPNTLTYIGNRAFANCKSLHSLRIPTSIQELGENPFALCDNLTTLYIYDQHPLFEMRDNALIGKTD